MKSNISRRQFIGRSLAAGALAVLPGSRVLGANQDIRLGVIGIGSFIKIGGKGRGDIRDFRKIPGVRVVALCDCDEKHLQYEAAQFSKRGEKVRLYQDFRALLDNPNIDAVSITTPNHWHSLQTIMACQADKDVFVQKPASHNIFEGRKMVEAMRKYERVVQATHGPRNSGAIEEAIEYAWQGDLGPIQYIYGLNYRPRMSIGKVKGPQPIPATCDYNLWCGPAPTKPLMREYLHYDWHWDWDTGDGDLGNMGIHAMDGCRWAARQQVLPRQVVSIGGRFGYDDDGQTPNSLISFFDYDPVPIMYEVRGLPRDKSFHQQTWTKNANQTMDNHLGTRTGFVIQCEGGTIRLQDKAAYDTQGKLIKRFTRERVSTKQNFIDVVRSRKHDQLTTDALEGHLSCGLVHMANTSYRVGRAAPVAQALEAIQGQRHLAPAFERFQAHLDANGIDLKRTRLTLGASLTLDPQAERYVGPGSDQANPLLSGKYRKPFVVPEKV